MDALTQQLLRMKLNGLGDPHALKMETEKLTADMRRGGYQGAAEDWMNKTEQLLGGNKG